MCIKDLHKPYSFSCHCPFGYSGEKCQNKVSSSSCPYVECQERRGDKVCDPQCRNVECDWDGGDCTLQRLRPWENCTASVPCWMYFHNNRCDPECNNPGCLFDSFECQNISPSTPSTCKYVPQLHPDVLVLLLNVSFCTNCPRVLCFYCCKHWSKVDLITCLMFYFFGYLHTMKSTQQHKHVILPSFVSSQKSYFLKL